MNDKCTTGNQYVKVIAELEAENERLESVISRKVSALHSSREYCGELKAENERLRSTVHTAPQRMAQEAERYRKLRANINWRNETIKKGDLEYVRKIWSYESTHMEAMTIDEAVDAMQTEDGS